MKHASLLCILCLLLLANTCKKGDTLQAGLMDRIWLHSFEEDQGDTSVYRPNTYDFPPSRGRTGFSLEPGGLVKRYEIAPTDGLEEHEGTWQLKGKHLVEVHMNESDVLPQDYTLEIVSLEKNVLKVRRNPGPEEK
ncbi:hypothetical protein [Pontibacter liquoris]|uniref:hypothetical protein n=1 Tax=Pontibacter liquoris TaxID=2905677 RepID=UPI001FA7D1AD|nr:hypothetical protein [Pontibacter liquoris]